MNGMMDGTTLFPGDNIKIHLTLYISEYEKVTDATTEEAKQRLRRMLEKAISGLCVKPKEEHVVQEIRSPSA